MFDQEPNLLEAYEKVFEHLFDSFLQPFWDADMQGLLSKKDDIIRALEHVDSVDEHAFWTMHHCWRALNVPTDANEHNIKFPLPPCSRMLLVQHVRWNVLKPPMSESRHLNCFA